VGAPRHRPRPISPFLTTGGVNPQKGTHPREVFLMPPIPGFWGDANLLRLIFITTNRISRLSTSGILRWCASFSRRSIGKGIGQVAYRPATVI
jgi:hypothetical protein